MWTESSHTQFHLYTYIHTYVYLYICTYVHTYMQLLEQFYTQPTSFMRYNSVQIGHSWFMNLSASSMVWQFLATSRQTLNLFLSIKRKTREALSQSSKLNSAIRRRWQNYTSRMQWWQLIHTYALYTLCVVLTSHLTTTASCTFKESKCYVMYVLRAAALHHCVCPSSA